MSGGELFLNLMQGYAAILAASLWPLVVLVVFFTIVFYIERMLRIFRTRRQMALTWKHLEQLVHQIEQHRSQNINADSATKRQYLVRSELQNARRALDRHDEKQIQRSLLSLSLLAQHSDRSLAAVQVPEEETYSAQNAEIIYPSDKG